jgi:hypothetical protein
LYAFPHENQNHTNIKKEKKLVILCEEILLVLLIMDFNFREASALANELAELPEESDQFRFLHAACLAHLRGVQQG